MRLARYRDIIPRYNEFKGIIDKDQPNEIRLNTLKSNKKELIDFLERKRISHEIRESNNNFIKLGESISNSLYHWLGLFYVQEFTSGIPPMALDPKSNERVLDMCAAPGSKTTQIAAMMTNKGEIIANDLSTNRLRALMGNIYRIGVLNTQVTQYKAQLIPEDKKFDKILVDAPCSGEGNIRKDRRSDGVREDELKSLCPVQQKLLDKAISMVKEEGIIVYSTCTFAPEENELIIEKNLSKKIELVDLEFDFTYSNGITRWGDKELSSDLKKCVRIYPHQIDSGGIFVAKLRKKS